MPAAPSDFANWSREDQLAWLYRNYGTIEDRQRAAGGNNALTSARFRASNIATADYVSPEERAAWALVKPDEGTWLGNALSSAAPYALAAGLAYAGGQALSGGTPSAAPGFVEGATAGGASTAAGSLAGLGGLANSFSGLGGNMSWMDWVGPAITVAGSVLGSRSAANATSDAERRSIAEQQRQFDLVRSDTAPQRALGAAAVNRLGELSGYGGKAPDLSSFYADPGRNFAISEGQQAIDRSAAARGGLLSGAAVKQGIRYATGQADQQYSAFYDRLLQQAGLGNTGIGASAAAGANAANNISSTAMNAGNTRASIYGNNAANISNALNTGVENTILRRYLGG